MNGEDFELSVRPLLPDSFTDHHEILLKISFGVVKPDSSLIAQLSTNEVTTSGLQQMYHTVQVEFKSSLDNEMIGSDETRPTPPDPNPYDVFLMETTIDRPTKHIAVCVRKRRELAWYNGSDILISISALFRKWRVASLSGPARVLQHLAKPPNYLTSMAMRRSMIMDTVEDVDLSLESRPSDHDVQRKTPLNESQRKALATVVSPEFQQGFFAIQGPPGCGKTSVLVAMIIAIGDGILVVAPSNAAVANVARKVFETGRFGLDEISVYGENADPTVHFLNPWLRGVKFVDVSLQ